MLCCFTLILCFKNSVRIQAMGWANSVLLLAMRYEVITWAVFFGNLCLDPLIIDHPFRETCASFSLRISKSVITMQRVVTEALTSRTYVEQTRRPLMIISPSIRHMFSHLTATYSKASSGKPYVLDTPIYKKMNNANGSQMGLGYSLHSCRLAKPPLKS